MKVALLPGSTLIRNLLGKHLLSNPIAAWDLGLSETGLVVSSLCAALRKICLIESQFETDQGLFRCQGMGCLSSTASAEFSDVKVLNVVTRSSAGSKRIRPRRQSICWSDGSSSHPDRMQNPIPHRTLGGCRDLECCLYHSDCHWHRRRTLDRRTPVYCRWPISVDHCGLRSG